MRALVIDADPHAAYAISRMLKERSVGTDQANGARLGLELARRNRYDIVLFDLDLTDASARQLLRRARGSDLARPILVMSRRDEPAGRTLALEAGADGYLAKPFNGAELFSRIRKLLPIPDVPPQDCRAAHGTHVDMAPRQVVLPKREAMPDVSTADDARQVAAPPSRVAA